MRKNVVKESEDSLKKAVLFLKNEKLVAIKTETVYGLACESSSKTAIQKVYCLKQRPLYLDKICCLQKSIKNLSML